MELTVFVRKLKHHQKGDTIVEVLIAIALVGSILGITYVTMNRNLLTSRDAQERTESTKIAQGQIESFKALSDTGTTFPSNTSFCINGTTTVDLGGAAPNDILDLDVFDATNYPIVPVIGSQNGCNIGFYHIAIKRDAIDTKLWRFYIRWDQADGNGRSQIIMVYRR